MMRKGLQSVWDKYSAEITIGLLLFLVWKLRGLFSALGTASDSVGSAIAGATASVQDAGKKAQQKAAIKTVNAKASDSDVQKFEEDAEALAQATGGKSALWANSLNTNWKTAYQIAKKYSRVVYRVDAAGKVTSLGLRKDSLRLAVLAPFYRDATGGRSLQADLDNVMGFASKDAQTFYAKYVK